MPETFWWFCGGMAVGFTAACLLTRRIVWEANDRYDRGIERWEGGTAEYRKACVVLETNRVEAEARRLKMHRVWGRLVETLSANLPPEVTQELRGTLKGLDE